MSCLSPAEITQLFSGQGELPSKGYSYAGLEHGLFPIQAKGQPYKGSGLPPAVEDPQLDSVFTAPLFLSNLATVVSQLNILFLSRRYDPPRANM